VSIKNKLVTAITTAGLLAGLFGSAFVPVVKAAGADNATQTFAATSPYATDTVYAYYLTSVYPSFTITINADDATADDPDDDGTYSLAVSGGTIRSCVAASIGGTVVLGSVVSTSTACSVPVAVTTQAGAAAAEVRWTVQLNKLASGDIVTITVADDDTATLGSSLKIQGVTAASTAAVDVSSTTSKTAITSGATANSAGTEWGVVYSDTAVIDVDVKNTYGLIPNPAPILTASLTGITGMGIFATSGDDCSAISGIDTNWYATADISSTVCIRRVDTTDVTVSGSGTLTISAGSTVIKSIAVRVYGDVASISVTQDDVTSIAVGSAQDGDAVTGYVGKMVYKDASGNTLPLVAANLDALDDAVSFKKGTTATSDLDAGDAADFDDFLVDNTDDNDGADGAGGVDEVTSDDGHLSFGVGLCTTSVYGDNVYTASYTNAASTTLTANFTITCTSVASKITGIAPRKTLVGPGEVFKIDIDAVDLNAKASGLLSTIPSASTLTLSPTTGTAAGEIRAAGGGAQALTDWEGKDWGVYNGEGYIEVTAPTQPGTYSMVLTYTDNDGTTAGSQAGTYTITVTVRNTNLASRTDLTVGPKKLKATANFGESAAGLKVAFVLENAAGVTRTFYRKANASGVATYTLALRGTWTVYATFGDNITDTGTMRR
jgi:hypothetical protein